MYSVVDGTISQMREYWWREHGDISTMQLWKEIRTVASSNEHTLG
jgi:hypothetical protein